MSNLDNIKAEQGRASVLNKSNIHGADLALYVSYLMDNGFYSDSIVKAVFLNNSLNTTGEQTFSVNNLGAALSQEIGYRAKLPLGFYIDPQAELSYGYLGNQSFEQQGANGTGSLKSSQEGIHTLRTRVGVNWGFDFKDFFEKDSKANAKLYLGTYFTYDYINGGKLKLAESGNIPQVFDSCQSTGRFVLNVGTNIAFSDDTRLYVDLERSFGGKIITEYQVNLGVRVNFGEKVAVKQVSQDSKKQVDWKAPTKEELEIRRAKEAQTVKTAPKDQKDLKVKENKTKKQ